MTHKPQETTAAAGTNNRPSHDGAVRRQQFEALALPLLDRLYAMALHLVRDPARADDMVQETFLRAWQNFDRFTLGTHFKAWIFQILTYLFLNDRRSAYRREASVDFAQHDVLEAPPESDPPVQSPSINTNWEALYPNLVDDALQARAGPVECRTARGLSVGHIGRVVVPGMRRDSGCAQRDGHVAPLPRPKAVAGRVVGLRQRARLTGPARLKTATKIATKKHKRHKNFLVIFVLLCASMNTLFCGAA